MQPEYLIVIVLVGVVSVLACYSIRQRDHVWLRRWIKSWFAAVPIPWSPERAERVVDIRQRRRAR